MLAVCMRRRGARLLLQPPHQLKVQPRDLHAADHEGRVVAAQQLVRRVHIPAAARVRAVGAVARRRRTVLPQQRAVRTWVACKCNPPADPTRSWRLLCRRQVLLLLRPAPRCCGQLLLRLARPPRRMGRSGTPLSTPWVGPVAAGGLVAPCCPPVVLAAIAGPAPARCASPDTGLNLGECGLLTSTRTAERQRHSCWWVGGALHTGRCSFSATPEAAAVTQGAVCCGSPMASGGAESAGRCPRSCTLYAAADVLTGARSVDADAPSWCMPAASTSACCNTSLQELHTVVSAQHVHTQRTHTSQNHITCMRAHSFSQCDRAAADGVEPAQQRARTARSRQGRVCVPSRGQPQQQRETGSVETRLVVCVARQTPQGGHQCQRRHNVEAARDAAAD